MGADVSIVIPTWNGLELLQRFLPSVLLAASSYSERTGASVEIIVVDDASSDATADWLQETGFRSGERALEKVLLINEENSGFGASSNRGVAAASNRLVFLLNNDVELDRDCIEPLTSHFQDPSVFAVHCRVFDWESGRVCGTGKLGGFARGFIRVHRSYSTDRRDPTAALYSMFAGGGSAMFDREKFLGLGGFDHLLAPFYWEDVELCYRAWKRGYSVLYEPRSVARHRLSSTIGKLNRACVRRIQQRNRLVYHWVHLHDRAMLGSHLAWVFMLTLTAPLRLNPGFVLSVFEAVRLLPRVLRRRAEEKSLAKRSDREVFELFNSLMHQEGIAVYDAVSELQLAGERKSVEL